MLIEKVKERLVRRGWRHQSSYLVWTLGPVTILDVEIRRDPKTVLRIDKALERAGIKGDGKGRIVE